VSEKLSRDVGTEHLPLDQMQAWRLGQRQGLRHLDGRAPPGPHDNRRAVNVNEIDKLGLHETAVNRRSPFHKETRDAPPSK
jgi:hypothetical protein